MKEKKGFTLVELLAVIVVLAIILIIAVPVVISSMNTAKKNSFKIYAQKALNAAKTKTLTDSALGEVSTTSDKCYTLTELGLETGNKYKGSVLYQASNEDYIIYLSDDDYIVQGLNFSEVSDNSKIKNSNNTTASSACVEVEIGSSGDSDDNSGENNEGETGDSSGDSSSDNTDDGTGDSSGGSTDDNTGDDSNFLRNLILAQGYDNLESSYYTIPGRVATSKDEGIRTTNDNYGTTYYYRGAVTDNFVEFANMCWRIVRINGDGSIKLVLFNYNSNADSNNLSGPCEENGNTYAFARYSGTTYATAFNSSVSSSKFVGLMYGSTGSTYNELHVNDIDSVILTNLKAWYDTNLRDYNDLLADTIWCNDKSLHTNASYFQGYGRLKEDRDTATPSLICPNAGTDGKLSKFTASDTTNGNGKLKSSSGAEYKIGLLTADEVAFAGAKYNTTNTSYYLAKNATGARWWTMTPSEYVSSQAIVFSVYIDGNLYAYPVNISSDGGYNNALRPAISLKPDIKVVANANGNYGDGTATNPFVVDEES